MALKKTLLFIDDDKQDIIHNIPGVDNIIFSLDEKKIMNIIEKNSVQLIVLDIKKTFLPGEELLAAIKLIYPQIPVIIFTEEADVNIVIECMRKNAFDYIIKNSVSDDDFVKKISSAIRYSNALILPEMEELRSGINYLNSIKQNYEFKNNSAFSEIITENTKMYSIFAYCEAVAKTKNTVLISGETGTGKELIARSIYNAGNKEGKFITCNVAGLDDQMFSDTLFGHKKGAFTGALTDRKGLIESAENGVIFLDEIGDMSSASQVKLLRLIQEKEYMTLGSDVLNKANIQILSATNHDLKHLVKDGKFRQDLYYRLMTHYIQLPSLKERRDDIPLILDYYLDIFSKKYKTTLPTYHPSLLILLKNYLFPGNIREFKSMIEDAVINHKSKMLSNDIFKKHIERNSFLFNDNASYSFEELLAGLDELPDLKSVSESLTKEALRRSNGNQSQAAKLLKVSHQALSKRLKKL